MADHAWFGATRQDRYVSRPDAPDLTVAVTLVRADGMERTFQTGLSSPKPEHVANTLDALTRRAREWFEETK